MVGIVNIDVKYRCGTHINCPQRMDIHCPLVYDLNHITKKYFLVKTTHLCLSLRACVEVYTCMFFYLLSQVFFLKLSLSPVYFYKLCWKKFPIVVCYTFLAECLCSQFSCFWIGNSSIGCWLIHNWLLRFKMGHPEIYFWSYVGCLLQQDWVSRSLHVPKIL